MINICKKIPAGNPHCPGEARLTNYIKCMIFEQAKLGGGRVQYVDNIF